MTDKENMGRGNSDKAFGQLNDETDTLHRHSSTQESTDNPSQPAGILQNNDKAEGTRTSSKSNFSTKPSR